MRNTFSTDRFFQGAYSLQVPGITENDHKALAHPVNKRLWFTGEYTNGYEYGFTHGAYEMGEKIAKQIRDCMKNNKCPTDKPTFSPIIECKTSSSAFNILPSLYFYMLLPFLLPLFTN